MHGWKKFESVCNKKAAEIQIHILLSNKKHYIDVVTIRVVTIENGTETMTMLWIGKMMGREYEIMSIKEQDVFGRTTTTVNMLLDMD